MNKITLFIDTVDNKKTIVKLQNGKKTLEIVSRPDKSRADEVLVLIEKILKDANVTKEDIDEIKVNTGPGSFTGIRVGVSIANTLSFSLQKRVNGKKLGEIELPRYE